MSSPSTQAYPYKNQVYEALRHQFNSNNLFNDSEFPPTDRSIYYTQAPPRGVTWRRPHQICPDPQFIVGDASRFDLDQGYLGNCWFIAAVSMITQRPLIFNFVVPDDQTFDKPGYNGLFHFRFWQFGKWYDVVVDDFLPVFPDGRLVYCSNKTEPNEFWSCLLEKAYAKLSWSYEGLDAGQTTDALIDMTGGIEETYNLKEVNKQAFFDVLGNGLAHDAMMGCSINADPSVREAKLANGLVRGHAYAMTAVVTLNVNGRMVRLVRCRNPWGNEVEWNGAWSDGDAVWNSIPMADRQNLGQFAKADGEFWVQICNISPDTLKSARVEAPQGFKWNCIQFDGEWVNGRSAGGCGQGYDKARYWTNNILIMSLFEMTFCEFYSVLSLFHQEEITLNK
ncbi:calpain-B-like isoform X3 [Brachionus plicatilis]|uniref:Calpain-B-like isoform X3 n=1 Tax=Brachionus plicatilis TaxID=10195 RepID=A0A3M7QDR1_BRAPC|nr:calpain-B-like isoform X3 [Brachionus plicatilis]